MRTRIAQTNMNELRSGGCVGADCEFSKHAAARGDLVNHFSFLNHKMDAKEGNVVILSEYQLSKADPFLRLAKERLHRTIPYNHYVRNLLQRNYYQVESSERVYAVAPIDWEYNTVKGGTGWAVEMARIIKVPEIYVYDPRGWFRWSAMLASFEPIVGPPPSPHGFYAGIGSRELWPEGKEAIRQLYE